MTCLFLIIPFIHNTEIKERDRLQERRQRIEKKLGSGEEVGNDANLAHRVNALL